SKVGFGTAVNWPVGIGGKGSEGVAGQVKQTPGGIGYFELAYAKQNKITSAAISNGAGDFPLPSSDGASACAASVANKLPADLRVRIAGCTGPNDYSISGFSWVVLHQQQKDQVRGAALVNLLWWMIHDGQSYATDLYYAPLPAPVVKLNEAKLQSVTYNGTPLLKS
ncbi:MAG TPA: phosphate ABC transporter substrate-binding protein PstS, partial [Chloroflexota bacterium]|nr:phosphate ABC transporter substrate-binding protein PstS [Chloroflexota bacterium]